MAYTLAQKIIAKAAGRDHVEHGEIVICQVDLAMIHDSSGPRRVAPILERLNATLWDPEKVVLLSDHFVPPVDAMSAGILDLTRKWAAEQGVRNFYDMQGICHVVLPERGHLKPGLFVVGGDSHSTTGGAFGCYMFGIGATEMAGVLATGETWIKVPETILINCSGRLAAGVSAKDMMLALCARLGMDGGEYQALQFAGEMITALPMHERMTITNMAAELGAQAGLIAADETTAEYLRNAGGDPGDITIWQGDADASYRAVYDINVSGLEPQVALPHSPATAEPVSEAAGTRIQQAYIGACTGAKLADLKMAAEVLRGRRVADGTRLLVAPASVRTTAIASGDGTLQALTEAGAILMPSGCGACAGFGAGVLADGEVCISSTARNFKGRMGANTSNVYLGSPYTVAASAVAGAICDPRDLLNGEVGTND